MSRERAYILHESVKIYTGVYWGFVAYSAGRNRPSDRANHKVGTDLWHYLPEMSA